MAVKLRTWLFMRANGDGTVNAVPFPSQDLAEHYAEDWAHKYETDRFPEDIYYDEFELDNDEVVPPSYIYEDY